MRDYLSFNQERWNRVAKKGIRFAVPLDHETIEKARQKSLSVSLTIGDPVPLTWFEQAPGKRLLGLACGGGQQLRQAGTLSTAKGALHLLQYVVVGCGQVCAAGRSASRPHIALRQHWRRQERKRGKNA